MQRRLIHTHAHTHTPHTHTHAHSMHSLHLWFFVTGGGQARSEADDHADTYLFFYYGTHTSRPQSLVLMRAGMCVIACVRVSLSPLTTSCGRLLHGLISFSLSLILFLTSVLTKKKRNKKNGNLARITTRKTHTGTHTFMRGGQM